MSTITGRRLPDGTLQITRRTTMTETPKTPKAFDKPLWSAQFSAAGFSVHNKDGVLANIRYAPLVDEEVVSQEGGKATVDRLISCWNAMAGIDDPSALLAAVDALVREAQMFVDWDTISDLEFDAKYPDLNSYLRFIKGTERFDDYARDKLGAALAAVQAARGEVQG